MSGSAQSRAGRGLAVFDMDGTLIDGDCGVLFVRHCVARGLLPARELLAWGRWLLRAAREGAGPPVVAQAKRNLLRVWRRLGEEQGDALYDRFFAEVLRPRVRAVVAAELRHAQREGEVYLLTANLRRMAQRLGRELGVPPGQCLGAEPRGALTEEIALPILMGDARAHRVSALAGELGVPLREVRAYGDSIHDAPMLRLAGRPCAVYPSPALRHLALREGWRVISSVREELP